jgi:serine/threonine-protein kinase
VTDLRDQLQTGFDASYAIERELGGGGMSRVFVATEHALGRRVVLKALPSNIGIDMSAERFAREITLAAGLQHPCIVPVLTAGVAHGVPYYTMPFVDGQTLRDRLTERKRLPVEEAIGVLRDVASALAHAHARGIVHRDIKPENILLSDGYAQVTDFGIARAVSQSRSPAHAAHGRLTETGLAIGTPAYMAPEQVAGDDAMDQRVDVYAFGCLAYELLTGAPPFAGRPPHLVLNAQIAEQPADIKTRRADLPANLAALVMRCLEKDPAKRPQSADDLVEFLRTPRQPARDAVAPAKVAVRAPARARIPAWAWYMTLTTAVAAIGVALFAVWPRSHEPKSVAVLPFANLGGDTTQEYFSDGITDDLISALAAIPGLRVAPRTSVFSLKGRPIVARDVGKQLGVADLLEGSVRRTGTGLRVNAMLIRTSDGVSRWTRTFDRTTADLFSVQDDITRSIARELRLELHPGADSLGRAHTPSAAAHDLVLRGEELLGQASDAGLRQAIEYFKQAAAADSQYARAFVGLATAYTKLADVALLPHDAFPDAIAAAKHALALDSTSAGAHALLGIDLLEFSGDWAAAKAELDSTLRLDPSNADAHEDLAIYEMAMGRPRRALAHAQRALALDPLSAAYSSLVERLFLAAREPDSAIAQHRRTQELSPGYLVHDSQLGEALRQKGMLEDALAEYEQACRALGHATPGYIITLHALGRGDEAKKLLRELESTWPKTYVPPELIAGAHARLGELGAAMTWLERGVALRSGALPGDGVTYDLEPLRGNPRYTALLEKLGMSPGVDPR